MKRKCKAGHLKCIYIYIHVYVFVVLQCKVTTIRLHSGRDFNQITIEFALIWSTAEVHQVVLSLASYMDT